MRVKRQKRPYSLFLRRLPGRKPVYYCKFRDRSGAYLPAVSTGCRKKPEAERWAEKQLTDGEYFFPRGKITLEAFAKDFFQADSRYVERQRARGKHLSPAYLDICETSLRLHVIPTLGSYLLDEIEPETVETWLFSLRDKGLAAETCNHALSALKAVFREAARLRLVKSDPAEPVERLYVTAKPRGVLDTKEVSDLLARGALGRVWGGNLKMYTIALIAFSTGARQGEILAIRRGEVSRDHVVITGTITRKHGRKDTTKGRRDRAIPIPSRVTAAIRLVMAKYPADSLEALVFFEGADPFKPLDHKDVNDALYAAMGKIGIDEEERRRRNLVFHGARHFFATYCRGMNVPDVKLREIVGHQDEATTAGYTHFTAEHFSDVRQVQEAMFKGKSRP